MANRPPKPPILRPGPMMQFDPALAAQVGVVAAAVLQRIWTLAHSLHTVRRQHAGRDFVLVPSKSLAAEFAFVSEKTTRRAVEELVKRGMVLRARDKSGGRDAAAWFAIDKEVVAALGTLFPIPRRSPATPTADRGKAQQRMEDTRGELP